MENNHAAHGRSGVSRQNILHLDLLHHRNAGDSVEDPAEAVGPLELEPDPADQDVTSVFLDSLAYPTALVCPSDLSISYCNQAACRFFGYSRKEMVGNTLHFLFPHARLLDKLPGWTAPGLSSLVHAPSPATPNAGHNVCRIVQATIRDGTQVWMELTMNKVVRNLSQSLRSSSGVPHALVTMRELSPAELSARVSRYEMEFEELEKIGKGGFGTVYRARNKIDGQEYAIKKVALRNTTDPLVVQEVKTFAKISNHPNVVRYHAAWIEPALLSATTFDPTGNSPSAVPENTERMASEMLHFPKTTTPDIFFEYNQGMSTNNEMLSGRSGTTDYFDDHDDRSTLVATSDLPPPAALSHPEPRRGYLSAQRHCKMARSMETASRDVSFSAQTPQRVTARRSSRRSSRPTATLYIQMQFCPFSDLRHWIQHRGSNLNPQQNLRILRQIIDGLSHIHSMGFVHRDLKPENIFIQDDHIFLGDFGLAKSVAEKVVTPTEGSAHSKQSSGHSLLEAGTFVYAAPEHTNWRRLSDKSDMFSLGILAVELYQPFATAMERAVVLTDIRKHGILPEEMVNNYPKESEFVQHLLAFRPEDRPSAHDLLQDPLFAYNVAHGANMSPSSVHTNLESANRVEALEKMVADLTKQVQNLQKELITEKHVVAPPADDRMISMSVPVTPIGTPRESPFTTATPSLSALLRPGKYHRANRMSAPSLVTAIPAVDVPPPSAPIDIRSTIKSGSTPNINMHK